MTDTTDTTDMTIYDEINKLDGVRSDYATKLDLVYATETRDCDTRFALSVLATDWNHAEQRSDERRLGEVVVGQIVYASPEYSTFADAVASYKKWADESGVLT